MRNNSDGILSSNLLLAVMTLLGIGLVQVYSSSFMFATESMGDSLYFFKRQLVFTVFSIGLIFAVWKVNLELVRKWSWILWAMAFLGVVLTLIPGVGVKVGGAVRWLRGPLGIRIEPSEVMKVAFSFWWASVVCRSENFLSRIPWWGLGALSFIPMALLLKQPDFGSFAIMFAVGFGLLFSFGLKWRWILAGVTAALPAFYFIVMSSSYRRNRVLAFLDPWSDPANNGFQVIQSMLSFHSGGFTGVGLGQGQSKLFFLPEAHTDFTLAVFGEEMGFLGFVILFLIYGFVLLRGFQISVKLEDKFYKILSLGCTLTLALNIGINAGVVMGLLPPKGLTLPFLSYGGSSLVCVTLLASILIRLEREVQESYSFMSRFQNAIPKNRDWDLK